MDRHVNLLYVHDDNVGHFAWIKNLSRLMSSQINKHYGRKYFCNRCLHYFSSNEKLAAHTVDCREMNDCAIKTLAKNDFEKNLYKLMNNAVFGKTMENVRNHVDVRLVTHWEGRYGAEAMIVKPNFHSRSVFSENLVAIEIQKLEVKFDKPIYVGMCILDISKTCLYEFYHEYMLPLYRDKCKVTYTDTDSLIYHIECDDVYDIIKRHIHYRFDTSDYAIDNTYGIPLVNKKVPGLMKDENNGAIMIEFVGLRAKMYALRVDGKKDTKKATGVKTQISTVGLYRDSERCVISLSGVSRAML
ncbi:uncharacterized protein LOC143907685 [Temnothorax americanus]|uniref:uncharacterized protein LOC143907685 n=1 Tax=Temnothorax americanus TaxID=1964332 RepID=UPI00406976AE